MKINAKAKVHLTIEVDAGTWSDDCQIKQLNDQAVSTALNKLAAILKHHHHECRMSGEPKVIGVFTEQE